MNMGQKWNSYSVKSGRFFSHPKTDTNVVRIWP